MKYKRWLQYLPLGIGIGLILLIGIGLYLVRDIFQKPVLAKKQVQQITVIQPPAPPSASTPSWSPGGGGNAILWYGQQLQREISDELQQRLKDKARTSRYSAVLHIWIGPDGSVTRVDLANSSGIAEVDEALKAALSGIRGRFKPPPEHMPQPVKIRIRS